MAGLEVLVEGLVYRSGELEYWALEYHNFNTSFLNGAIMKQKVYTFFSLVT